MTQQKDNQHLFSVISSHTLKLLNTTSTCHVQTAYYKEKHADATTLKRIKIEITCINDIIKTISSDNSGMEERDHGGGITLENPPRNDIKNIVPVFQRISLPNIKYFKLLK